MKINTLNFEAKNKSTDVKQFAHIHAEFRAMVGQHPCCLFQVKSPCYPKHVSGPELASMYSLLPNSGTVVLSLSHLNETPGFRPGGILVPGTRFYSS